MRRRRRATATPTATRTRTRSRRRAAVTCTSRSGAMASDVMGSDRYDLIVIGAGPAGQSAAEFAAWTGRRAVIVERAHAGGVVATTGGAPTKTLRETALELTGLGRRR